MNDEHINAFVSECRESITDLNNALLALEDDPTDEEAIEAVFRTAHTLKGNFGAMGFENASELAHALEDLLDEIRGGDLEVRPEIMDAAFEGVDHIESIVDEVEADGESRTDPSETIERLRATVEGDLEAADESGESGDAAPASDANPEGADAEAEAGASDAADDPAPEFAVAEAAPEFEAAEAVVHANVGVDPDGMLGVDGMLVLEAVIDGFERAETAPDRDAIEEGDYDGRFDVFVPDADPAEIEAELAEIGAVAEFAVAEVSGTAEGSAEGGADETGEGEADADADSGGEAEAEADPPADDESESEPSGGSGGSAGTSGGSDISSVRVDVDRLDELHGLVEQLVTGRITIRRAIENDDFETAETTLNDFDKVTSRLQNTVMDMRLIPLRRVVSNLPRVVRDVAREQGKEVSFEMRGEDIELDRSILTEIEDPLIHILRNAVDHGIESPGDREAAGKPREGSIELRASRQRDHVTIEVEDDGDGIDPDAVRAKAVEEEVVSEAEAESLSDDDVYDLVFHPGFSTAEEVTDVSGRGVGMDVVHSTVEQLDGSVNVDSEPWEGTTVQLRLPVSVAIVNVLFVRVDEMEYGIPIKNIDELTHASDIERVDGDEVVRHDDDVYPVIELEEALAVDDGMAVATDGGSEDPADADGADGSTPETATERELPEASDPRETGDGMLVRIRDSVRPVALRCDAFTDQEEVVVKPLEGSLSGIPGLSGTAILGDGNIVPILDVVSLEA